MGLMFLLANLGISVFDIILLKNKDINTCRQIKKILECSDYKIITNKNIRKEIWDEIFKNNRRVDNIEHDDIEFFYKLSLLPGINLFSLYQNLLKENSEINETYKLCVNECLNEYIIKKLIEDEYIVKDDCINKQIIKTLKYGKKEKCEKNINK
ncbi:MAG: hypothetical protein IJ105_04685 [Bacilli bacterium]|nr:hypothetical protein [Bacilli bacterium]